MNAATRISPDRARAMIEEELGKPAPSARLADTLVALGKIKLDDVDEIERARNGKPFGRTALRLGKLKADDLQYALGVHLGFLHATREPVAIPPELVVAGSPFCDEAEAIRALRTRLMTETPREKLKSVAITGLDNRDGAIFTAINLAASFAQLGRRTLLVDADLRTPCLARIFGDPTAEGLADAIAGRSAYESVRSGSFVRHLDILPAGASAPDPQSLLGGAPFKKLMDRAAGEFDAVLVLTAPFGAHADCEFVWANAASALLVARKDHTRARTVAAAKASLRRIGADVAGAVLSG